MTETPDPEGSFDYSNLSGRPPSHFVELMRKHLPGVDRVQGEIVLFASEWHQRNVAALASPEPLWVVLGDSISQGVGASAFDRGWVPRAQQMLAQQGLNYRVLNLSVSGARTADVVERQIPATAGIGVTPALVTVLIGSNDVVRREYREALQEHYRRLIDTLPPGAFVAVQLHAFGVLADAKRMVESAAAEGALHAVAIRFGLRHHAEDHFHPDDVGHDQLAVDFVAGIMATSVPLPHGASRPA